MMETEPGLRERKRRATRLAIQHAAVQLVLERGSGVTVEEISQLAEVSPRTFFNYFPTKEDALLGSAPSLPTGEIRERFVTAGPGSDLIDDLCAMLANMPYDQPSNSEVYQLRRELVGRYPELAARRLLSTRELEFQLLAIVEERLVNDAGTLPFDLLEVRAKARLVTFAAFGVLRSAWMRWVDLDGSMTMSECIRSAFADAQSVFGKK